jgi:hypothetical protein
MPAKVEDSKWNNTELFWLCITKHADGELRADAMQERDKVRVAEQDIARSIGVATAQWEKLNSRSTLSRNSIVDIGTEHFAVSDDSIAEQDGKDSPPRTMLPHTQISNVEQQ